MAVPKKVREQAEAAERALDEAMKAEGQGSREQASEAQAPEQIDSTVQVAQPLDGSASGVADNSLPANTSPEIESIRAELERERQLRRTLEGRIASQLKPANEANRQMKAQIEELTAKVKTLLEGPAKPGAMRHITEEEASELGAEIIDVQSRIVKGIIEEAAETGIIAQRLSKVLEANQVARESELEEDAVIPKAGFWDAVERLSPGARETNREDSGWADFLDMHDAYTGRLHREVAEEAISGNEPYALAGLFDAYKAGKPAAGRQAPKARPQAQQPVARPDQAGSPFVNPDGSLVNGGERFTQAQVKQFYNDLARNRYKGREDEARKLDERIMAAAQAGLITD
jgi:chemotaxis protein histidine kinase CheA